MLLHLSSQRLDDLLCRVEVRVAQYVEQTLIAELLVLAILSLVQSVGVDEQRTTVDVGNLLALEFQPGQYADWEVRLHLEEVTMVSSATNNRRVMTGIAEIHVTCLQVDESQEESHKHTVLVIIARKRIVHTCAYLCRFLTLCGQRTEQSCSLRHKQRGWYTLTTDVTNSEIEFIAL